MDSTWLIAVIDDATTSFGVGKTTLGQCSDLLSAHRDAVPFRLGRLCDKVPTIFPG
jgi:hypothetical protein